MEDYKGKLYFRPETTKKDRKQGQDRYRSLLRCIVVICFVALIIFVLWLLRGKTTFSGRYPENIINTSLSCTSNQYIPPRLASIDADNTETKISAVFDEFNMLKSLSFVYALTFSSEDLAYGAEAKLHAEFNKTLAVSGYGVEKFDNKFTRYDNKLSIALHAKNHTIDKFSAPYFGIVAEEDNRIPQILEEFRSNYERQGFICEVYDGIDNSKEKK